MTVETAPFISDLNDTYPAATDQKAEGDDHIRLIKTAIKATFPNVTGEVDATHTELNDVVNKLVPGGALGTPSSGNLSNCTVNGTDAPGAINIPQNSQSAAYTLVLADAGKQIFHPGADTTARIWTIPANGAVAFPIGTAVTFINGYTAGVITISITTDTLRLATLGTTGSRTLDAMGIATAVKVTATEWVISGSGLS